MRQEDKVRMLPWKCLQSCNTQLEKVLAQKQKQWQNNNLEGPARDWRSLLDNKSRWDKRKLLWKWNLQDNMNQLNTRME